jgi:SAM-dependent methyltransferase
MELSSGQVKAIEGLLDGWTKNPEIEVEATFGFRGQVKQQVFLRVIQRLQSKGLQPISQEDKLNICLADNLRFSLTGAHVAQYCRDNTIKEKPFVAIIKDRTVSSEDEKKATMDIPEYDVRVKARREKELAKDDPLVLDTIAKWARVPKFFRLIRRWTFKQRGLIFDLSMVRSTKRNSKGFSTQLTFQEQNILNYLPAFEIEVELDRGTLAEGWTQGDVMATLIRGIGELLRGIQNNTVLTRKSTRDSVMQSYKALVGTGFFRGNSPVTLQIENMTPLKGEDYNIRFNYNVTDKADGLRVHGFTDDSGELFMIDMAMNVYRTGLKKIACRNCLLDGEYVTADKKGMFIQNFLLFDVYYYDRKDVSQKPFKTDDDRKDTRYGILQEWITQWTSNGGPEKILKNAGLLVAVKKFFFPNPASSSQKSIFDCVRTIFAENDLRIYTTDGIIFTPNDMGLPAKAKQRFSAQFKWKPAEDNTIDFLVLSEKKAEDPKQDRVRVGIHPKTKQTVRYKTFSLQVGSTDDPALKDPRETILNLLPIPEAAPGRQKVEREFKPILFVPMEFSEEGSSICRLEVQTDPQTQEEFCVTERTSEPIRDRSIVEMRYDFHEAAGWRWIPIRVRADKTERFLRNEIGGSLNSDMVAQNNWNSIQNPITHYMITTGSEVPSSEELAEMGGRDRPELKKKYYERKPTESDQKKVSGLHEFHNHYIKDDVLYGSVAKHFKNPILLDLACGRGGDIHRWRRTNASFVLGTDVTGECCLNNKDGAYKRLLNTLMTIKTQRDPLPVPPMFFVIADSSKRLIDGSAGANEREANLLRAICGRVAPTQLPPPAVLKYGRGVLKEGADVCICMYALHYFFENAEKLNGLLQNLADTLKIGGYFIGTNFDGQAVFDALRPVETGKSLAGYDVEKKTMLWEITKHYEGNELPIDDAGFGYKITNYFISIGIQHDEYLVPWPLLVAKLKTIGVELVEPEELAELGMKNSTNMYSASWTMAQSTPQKKKYEMSDSVKEYSFLNRWYIFKRTSKGTGVIGDVSLRVPVEDEAEGEEGFGARVATRIVSRGAEGDKEVEGEISELAERVKSAALIEEADLVRSSFSEDILPAQTIAAVFDYQQQLDRAEKRKDLDELKKIDEQVIALQKSIGKITQAKLPEFARPGQTARTILEGIAGRQNLTIPVAGLPGVGKDTYTAEKVVLFSENSPATLVNLTIPNKEYASYAGRHLAPNAPFRIRDITDRADTTTYPSITHFLAAMKLKYASNKPALGAALFGTEGSIHQTWVVARANEASKSKKKELTKTKHNELVLKETTDVETKSKEVLSDRSIGFNESLWATQKDSFLEDAIKQRLTGDAWFCTLVSAAEAQGKYLLYEDKAEGSEMGGTRNRNGTIRGQNKYGRFIQRLAKENPEGLKKCMTVTA